MIIDEKIEDLGIPFNDPFIFYFLVGVNSEIEMSLTRFALVQQLVNAAAD